MEITLSIVGTAGRREDAQKLHKAHFQAMCLIADGLVNEFNDSNYSITHLVSGGAAWADHVAVQLFLSKKVPKLRLFLPCEWDHGAFADNGSDDFKVNPGRTANHYHKKFQTITRINSLSEIQSAISYGAEIINGKGFHARNALVAKSDFILACTFGNKHEVKDGGTAHTIENYLRRVKKEGLFDKSFHYDLNSNMLYPGAVVPKQPKIKDFLRTKIMNMPGVGPSFVKFADPTNF